MVFLTPLAPDITQAILEGRQPKGLKLATSPYGARSPSRPCVGTAAHACPDRTAHKGGARAGASIPKATHAVYVEGGVDADERQAFSVTLGDQHAIERIAKRPR